MYGFKNPLNFQKNGFNSFSASTQKNKQFPVPQWLLSRYHDKSFITWPQLSEKKNKSIQTWHILLNKFGKISPDSTFLLLWNNLVVISIMFNFYQIPISMFFTNAVYQSEFTTSTGILINIVFTVCLFMNVFFVRPFTSFYLEGKLIQKKSDIFKRYMRLEFWFNVTALVSLLIYIFSNNQETIYGKILFYLMVFNLFRTNNMIATKIQIYRKISSLYKLISLLSFLLLLLIWIASVFFAIDYSFYLQQNQYFPVNLWLTNTVASQSTGPDFINIVQTYEWQVWLNYSMYWVLQTVSGVGYGDITPRNPVQVAYCDVVIVVFCLSYALFLNSVWQIIKELIGKTSKTHKKIINYYQRNYQIQKQILMKLQNYAFYSAETKEREQKQQIINQKLSDDLRNQLMKARQNKIFAQLRFFTQLSCLIHNQYEQFLFDLVTITKQSRYGSDEIIVLANQKSSSLSNILNGEIVLSYPSSKLKQTISEGEKHKFFGTLDFLCRKYSSYSVVTSKCSKISQISQEDYLQKLRVNHKAKIQCFFLYQQIRMYGRHELASQKCWSCKSLQHNLYQCPKYFSWLQNYRNSNEILKMQAVKKSRITFRIYFPRKATNFNKVVQGKCYNYGNFKKKLYKINYLNVKLEDKLQIKCKNQVDKIQSYSEYRRIFNI